MVRRKFRSGAGGGAGVDADSLGRFFQFSRDLLAVAGFDGYFKCVDGAWEQTLGLTEAELTSRPFVDFVHPDDRSRTEAEAASLGTAGTDTINFENRYRARDGGWRWLQWTARALPREQLIYAIARDVTDQRHTAEALTRLASIVENSDDAIFSYGSGA